MTQKEVRRRQRAELGNRTRFIRRGRRRIYEARIASGFQNWGTAPWIVRMYRLRRPD